MVYLWVTIYENRWQVSSSLTASHIARLSVCINQYLNLASRIPRILAIYSVHVPLDYSPLSRIFCEENQDDEEPILLEVLLQKIMPDTEHRYSKIGEVLGRCIRLKGRR